MHNMMVLLTSSDRRKGTLAFRHGTAAIHRSRLATALFMLAVGSVPLGAQTTNAGGRHEIFAGSEIENYLRYQQSMGGAPIYPWSLRPFSPSEVEHLLSGAVIGWSSHYDIGPLHPGRWEMDVIAPAASVRFNSSFPYGYNDGALWAGKGLTTAIQGGFFLRYGPLSLTVAPIAFRSENSAFTLEPAGAICPPTCADPNFPKTVDRPQRFGNSSYTRIDPGQSTLRLDAFGASAGITTANEWWGPAQIYPYLLGNNAPGFVHVFFGTQKPVNIFIGHLSARVLYGRLDQSAYSPVKSPKYAVDTFPGRVRFASGVLTVFQPRGINGLEIGLARFFDSSWPASGIPGAYLRRPLRGPFSSSYEVGNSTSTANSDQLGSVFARWVFPHSALELYGEYGREDSQADLRAFIQEPDFTRAYSLGLRKAFNKTPDGFSAVHFELMNYQLPELARYRGDGITYTHNGIPQGQTNRGQLLGAPLGVGTAAGSTLGWDRYDARGRTTFAWERVVSQERGLYFKTGVVDPRAEDVSHALRVQRVTFLRSLDLTSGVTLVRDLNRNFQNDAWNLNAILEVRYPLR